LLFLIDAQLPPSLAEALRQAGCQALHVADIGLLTATDRKIWDEAVSRNAALVTKDRDFPQLRAAWETVLRSCGSEWGTPITQDQFRKFWKKLPEIIRAAERGKTVIEFVAR
jgi:G:T/U-mismatch repair DNA glycosylase